MTAKALALLPVREGPHLALASGRDFVATAPVRREGGDSDPETLWLSHERPRGVSLVHGNAGIVSPEPLCEKHDHAEPAVLASAKGTLADRPGRAVLGHPGPGARCVSQRASLDGSLADLLLRPSRVHPSRGPGPPSREGPSRGLSKSAWPMESRSDQEAASFGLDGPAAAENQDRVIEVIRYSLL